MAESVFRQRVRAAGLSLWELGDLLGIHPHHLSLNFAPGANLPATVLIDLARRLDMHPAELVPALNNELATTSPEHGGDARTDVVDATTNETTPYPEPDATVATTERGDADAMVVLTGLATAVEPLATDDLAAALEWPLRRVVAALGHAADRPVLAGPLALRRTGHGTYTVTARLNQLSEEQLRRLTQNQLYRHPLTADQAHMLLAAFALKSDPPGYREQRAAHPDAERKLKRAGLLRAEHNPDRPTVSQDVWFSLRYFNIPPEDH